MRKEKRQTTAQQKAQQVVNVYAAKDQTKTDPLGSWTGRPVRFGRIWRKYAGRFASWEQPWRKRYGS